MVVVSAMLVCATDRSDTLKKIGLPIFWMQHPLWNGP